jgi:hypothetical protein
MVKTMNTDTGTNADDWKTGTDAIALCMICGSEYAVGTRECPDCHVSLSVVRRCPNCHRVVSAQHSKCVYCRSSFTHELPKDPRLDEVPDLDRQHALSVGVRRFRAAAVSIATFVTVFCLGLVFLRQINKPIFTPQIIAKSSVLHSAQLRRAPSLSSSIVGKAASGTAVSVTGFRENDQGRWMTLDWNNAAAYLPVSDLSAPRAVDGNGGGDALNFYISAMDAESVDEAVKQVDYYARAFPDNAHGEELKWALAERVRALSQRGGSQGSALRREANQLYQQLVALNGKYAEKAQDALTRTPSAPETEARPRVPRRKADGLQIIGGSGTEITTSSTPHEALVLTQAEVIVRAGKLSQATAGDVLTGHVALQVKTNGILAIPAGALCHLTVSKGPSESKLGLALTSIEIDHRFYAVKSQTIDIPSGDADRQTVNRGLSFHLEAPLVIER